MQPSNAQANLHSQIKALARPQDMRGLSITGLHVVMAIRLCAAFDRAGRDPVPDLAARYRSVEAACAVDGLVRTVKHCWPEPFMVNRPCCLAMTGDEATLAHMTRAAMAADRDEFARAIEGFVPIERHEALFSAAVHATALLLTAHDLNGT